ncbi:hypothetical protein GH5_01297 [Leishmania sp. Ghana 2012 LV757]|uniref:hypothetical protein n=1 Tax=Leishmania sp. Ghana 2012 LV757 TaxID=2803181 RepID=UPI001B7B0083|nr:hypothetical protein GH5_01297 [Leishmania sp. Ghana 2012 LV757]
MSSSPTVLAATLAGSSSPPGSPSSATAPVSPSSSSRLTGAAVLPPSASAPVTSPKGALTVGATSRTVQLSGDTPEAVSTDVVATNSGTIGTATASSIDANVLNNGRGTGYGMGLDPYGTGGMYSGYGGLGMGGMYGGLGMMGMGGMGMGMYGMGMTPEAQRAQMMMFMTSRIMELWGMFSQVMQMTLSSAVQFVGEYVGINQRMGQLEEENLNHEERYLNRKYELRKALSNIPREQRYVPKQPRIRKPKRPSFLRRFILRLLRHVALFAAAYFFSKQILRWVMSHSGKKLLETSAYDAVASSSNAKIDF